MNRRLKLLILLLLTAVLCLSAAIASLRLTETETNQTETENQPAAGSSAVTLFVESNGLWGARAANGRVLIEPTWYYLRTMSDTVLIARRSDGKTDRFGLIQTNGDLLIPFLYYAITPADASNPDVWLASFMENDQQRYHLYHADGTRWSDTTWDSCSCQDGILTAEIGSDQYEGILTEDGIVWQSWHTEYPIGLHQLTMDFDADALSRLPDEDTLRQLGETAAAYLRCLFVTKDSPDDSLLSSTDNAALRIGYLDYDNCRLQSANISSIRMPKSEGLPTYRVQIQVRYQREERDGSRSMIDTAMILTISRNAAGMYTYSGFFDAQMFAAA